MEQETNRIENPRNNRLAALGFVTSGYALALGIFMFVLTDSFIFLLLGGGVAIFVSTMIWFRLFHDMPRYVVIEKNGILFIYSNNRTRAIPFSSLKKMNTEYARSSKPNEIRYEGGALFIKGKLIPVLVSSRIRTEIIKGYQESVGALLEEKLTQNPLK